MDIGKVGRDMFGVMVVPGDVVESRLVCPKVGFFFVFFCEHDLQKGVCSGLPFILVKNMENMLIFSWPI